VAQWNVRVKGKQRKEVDRNLVVQAVVALGRQLAAEERATNEAQPEKEEADS
jgi:hypothetical protein